MIEREAFAQHVRDALAHLHDRPYLQSHPLAQLLAPRGRSVSGDDLRRTLLDAVEELRPDPTAPPQSAVWRRYHHLNLRYVQGLTLDNTARKLQLSLRQAYRDHAAALEAVVSVLWSTYSGFEETRRSTPTSTVGTEASGSAGESTIDAELARLMVQSAEGPVGVEETLDGALATLARMAEERGVSFSLALPGGLGGLPNVNLSRLVLRQVFLTILSYIVEATPGSRVAIALAEIPPFVQAGFTVETAGRAGKAAWPPATAQAEALLGAGRRLLESQGGVLQVVEDGSSLTITLSLPAAPVSTVLVIDDNPDLVRLFRRYLRGKGYRLVQATNAQRALRLIRETKPDVILLDVLMPTQDGWEILQQLRASPETQDIPTIVCSVLPDHTLALSLGAAGFLPKPVTEEALQAALARVRPSVG